MHFLHGSIAQEFIVHSQHYPKYGTNSGAEASIETAARTTKMAFASDIQNSARTLVRPGFFADLQERFARYRLYSQTVNELSALSGRDLADLGICRAQIRARAYEVAYGDQA